MRKAGKTKSNIGYFKFPAVYAIHTTINIEYLCC